MTFASGISVLGLLLDMGGAFLLWSYGLPPDVQRGGVGFLALEEIDPAEAEKAEKYERRGNLGFAFLFFGFLGQLAGTLLSGQQQTSLPPNTPPPTSPPAIAAPAR